MRNIQTVNELFVKVSCEEMKDMDIFQQKKKNTQVVWAIDWCGNLCHIALSNKCQYTASHQTDKQRRRWRRNKWSICTVQLLRLFTLPASVILLTHFLARESFVKWFIRSVSNSIINIPQTISNIPHDFCVNKWRDDFSPESVSMTSVQSIELKPFEELKISC